MSQRIPVSTPDAPAPGGAYNQVIVAGDLVFTAGFGPVDPQTGTTPDGIEAQTAQVLQNLAAALTAAGSGLDALVKTTVHLASLDDFAQFDKTYRATLPEPFPVRTTVGSVLNNILVEVDAVALRG